MANAFVRRATHSGIYYAFNSWLRNVDVRNKHFSLEIGL